MTILYMSIQRLYEKRQKARAAFLRHRFTNETNNVELANNELAKKFLKNYFDEVYETGDSFLNFLGADYFCVKDDTAFTVDLKVCKNCPLTNIMIDVYKCDDDEWHSVMDNKLTEFYLYVTQDYFILLDREQMIQVLSKVKDEDTFFLPRDLYHTTRKAVIDVCTVLPVFEKVRLDTIFIKED